MRWLFALAALVLTAVGRAQAPDASNYIGSNACRTCHADVWSKFYKNPHSKSEASGCEGCHGPGKAHVEAHGGRATIRAFSAMEPQQALDTCLGCHAHDLGKVNIRRSPHTLANVVCTNCHSIHKSPVPKFLLARRQIDLCYQCHLPVQAAFAMPVKHHVNEGFMQCTDCHNPHGTFAATWRMGIRPRMVSQASGNEQACLKCHTDKRGPFVFEHAAVRVDGCETCHLPHGSTNARLLRRPALFSVCLNCHNGAGAFGRSNSGVFMPGRTHNMLDPRFQRCTTCHVRIHGSNSDPLFLR